MTQRTYIIAEAGVNHDGDVEDALRLVDAAADAGADCVKFQTFRADDLATGSAAKAAYQQATTGAAEGQRDMLRRLELPFEAHHALIARARGHGIGFLSTPFDRPSLDFLTRDLALKRIKIGSGDMTNAPFLLAVAEAGCDLILSTGMATLGEVEQALGVLAFGYASWATPPSRQAFAAAWASESGRDAVRTRVMLLHCTTQYPAPFADVNLKAMDTLGAAFGLPVGYSDHTLGPEVSVAAVARGAVMIEKHLTLDCTRSGPDHASSLDPAAFTAMVTLIRNVEAALGDGRKHPRESELANMAVARKSIVTRRPIAQGEEFTSDNIAVKRPGIGIDPIMLWDLVGRRAHRAYAADELIEP